MSNTNCMTEEHLNPPKPHASADVDEDDGPPTIRPEFQAQLADLYQEVAEPYYMLVLRSRRYRASQNIAEALCSLLTACLWSVRRVKRTLRISRPPATNHPRPSAWDSRPPTVVRDRSSALPAQRGAATARVKSPASALDRHHIP